MGTIKFVSNDINSERQQCRKVNPVSLLAKAVTMKMEFVRHNIVQLAETYDVKPELYNTIIFSKVSYKIT